MRARLLALLIVAGTLPAIAGPATTPTSPAPAALTTVQQLWQKIVVANLADLQYAKALADAAGTPGGKMRSACYAALIAVNQQANGAGLKDASGNPITPPNPAVVTGFEQAEQVVEALQPTSNLVVACAPVANALKLSVAQVLAMAVTGGASLAALGVALP